MPDGLVSGDELLDALRSLRAKLHRRGITADVYIFGGAAMVIAYRARPATRDIDAVFEPDTEVLDAAHEVAYERHWPRGWLNRMLSTAPIRPRTPRPARPGSGSGSLAGRRVGISARRREPSPTMRTRRDGMGS